MSRVPDASQGAHRTGRIFDDHNRGVGHSESRIPRKMFAQRAQRNVLQIRVQVSSDFPGSRQVGRNAPLHELDEMGSFARRFMHLDARRGAQERLRGDAGRKKPGRGEPPDVATVTDQGGIRILPRVQPRRRLRQTGQEYRFGKRENPGGLSKIGLSRGFRTKPPVSVVETVQIGFEDALLLPLALQPQGRKPFPDLSRQGPLAACRRDLDELLGDRGGAGNNASVPQIPQRRGGGGIHVHAAVFPKARIFNADGDHGHPKAGVFQSHRIALSGQGRRQDGNGLSLRIGDDRRGGRRPIQAPGQRGAPDRSPDNPDRANARQKKNENQSCKDWRRSPKGDGRQMSYSEAT